MTDAAPDFPLASSTWAEATRQLNPMVKAESNDFAAGIPAPNAVVGNCIDADDQGHDDYRRAETVLEEAARTADGPREAIYGHPVNHFTATGKMWAAILGARFGIRFDDIPPETVALMFDADKTIRLCETPGHRDSLVDKVGYTRCYERVWDHRD